MDRYEADVMDALAVARARLDAIEALVAGGARPERPEDWAALETAWAALIDAVTDDGLPDKLFPLV